MLYCQDKGAHCLKTSHQTLFSPQKIIREVQDITYTTTSSCMANLIMFILNIESQGIDRQCSVGAGPVFPVVASFLFVASNPVSPLAHDAWLSVSVIES